MKELIIDLWALIAEVAVSCWAILGKALDLVIIDDPFWRGVEVVILLLLTWNNRKELISLIDRIPLLGGLVAKGLGLGEQLAEWTLSKGHSLWVAARSRTWDRLVGFVLKSDEQLRK